MSIDSDRVGIGEDIGRSLLPGYVPWIFGCAANPALAEDFAASTHITGLMVPA
jgi:hypothetical protein